MIRKALILGVRGGFGRLFLGLLEEEGVAVTGVDRASLQAKSPPCRRYLEGDAVHPEAGLLAEARQAEVLLVCLPEGAAFEALARFVPELPPGALVVDTLSVKVPVARWAERLGSRVEWVSLNPLGGPDLGLRGRNIATVALVTGPRGQDFLAFLERQGARLAVLSPERHDRLVALTQVSTHCAILSFGMCLGAVEEEWAALAAVSTPPFATLLALWGRILAQDPEVYWHVQRDNPQGAEARARFVEKARELQRLLAEGDHAGFRGVLDSARARWGAQAGEWALLAECIFKGLARST